MPPILAKDPVSDILLAADRLGVTLQPSDLPETAYRLYEAVHAGLAPRLWLTAEQQRFIALDTAVALCAELCGRRLLPSGVDLARDPIARCLAAHGGSAEWVSLCLTALRTWCAGGLEVPSLKHLEYRLRDERIRRDFRGGLEYAAIARRYHLHPRQVRRIIAAANGSRHGTAGRKLEQTEAVT